MARSRTIATTIAGLTLALMASEARAQASPWLDEPGTGTLSLSYSNQNATEFYRQTTRVKGPLEATSANLAQNTLWMAASWTPIEPLAIDIESAWADSFVAGAVGPSGGRESYSGLFDTNIAARWRIRDGLVDAGPTVTLRVGGIVAGGYETGYINSLGDGGNGVETSVIVGKYTDMVSLTAEVGYRRRGNAQINPDAVGAAGSESIDVPDDVFAQLGAYIPLGAAILIGGEYHVVDATSGIDIGGPGFSPSRFPGLQEDSHILSGRLIADLSDTVTMNITLGQVVRGRNTAASELVSVGITMTLGRGQPAF